MRFDVVIGNPPYNNDIYLDFIHLGYGIADKVCMITPIKFWCKADKVNERFRNRFNKHIKHIVCFRNTHDIFDIGEPAGIAYYLIDHNTYDKVQAKFLCKKNELFYSNSYEVKEADRLELLPDKLVKLKDKILWNRESIHEYIGFRRQVYVGEQERGIENKDRLVGETVDIMQGSKLAGYILKSDLFTLDNLYRYKCIEPCMSAQGSGDAFDENGRVLGSSMVHIIDPNQVPKGSFQIMAYFDTLDEAKSFKSYINSKTMSCMQFLGISGTQVTKAFFRYVPNETDWTLIYDDDIIEYSGNIEEIGDDGIYTDINGIKRCSLYRKYNLTSDEINIIESIIKGRK